MKKDAPFMKKHPAIEMNPEEVEPTIIGKKHTIGHQETVLENKEEEHKVKASKTRSVRSYDHPGEKSFRWANLCRRFSKKRSSSPVLESQGNVVLLRRATSTVIKSFRTRFAAKRKPLRGIAIASFLLTRCQTQLVGRNMYVFSLHKKIHKLIRTSGKNIDRGCGRRS